MSLISKCTKVIGGTTAGILLSTLVHAALVGSIYYGMMLHKSAPIVADLDLSMTPLVPRVPNAGGGHGSAPSQTWVAPKKGPAPLPTPAPVQETKESVVHQENNEAPPCTDCPQSGVTGTGWGGGTGEGSGTYVPAEQAFRKPRWVKNFITSRDYPLVARQAGKDGRVVLIVLIDETGRVRDARLAQGSYEALNAVALRKVREAEFTPAYDEHNRPLSCKVMLPIRFELK